jgi:hypothetical protein
MTAPVPSKELMHRVCQWMKDEQTARGHNKYPNCEKCELVTQTPYGPGTQACVLQAQELIRLVQSAPEPPPEQPSVTEIIRQMRGRAAASDAGGTIEVLLSDLRSFVTGMQLARPAPPPETSHNALVRVLYDLKDGIAEHATDVVWYSPIQTACDRIAEIATALTPTKAVKPVCPECKGARQICTGNSGSEADGYAPILERCEACDGSGLGENHG